MDFDMKEFDLSQLVIASEQLVEREPGIHVSGIIRYMRMHLGKQRNDFSEDDLSSFATIGRLWERLLEDIVFKDDQYGRPGPCQCDNIWGSPDSVDFEEWSLAEFKVCFKSYRNFDQTQKWWEYMLQIKSYCYMLEMTKAQLIVLFPCGNWKDDPVPKAIEWNLRFTQQELAENWRVMVNNARSMEQSSS